MIYGKMMNYLKLPKYKYYFAFADVFIISLAFVFSTLFFTRKYSYDFTEFLVSIGLYLLPLIIVFIFIFDINNLYKINIIFTRAAHLTALIKSYFYATLITASVVYFSKHSADFDSRQFVISFIGIGFFMFYMLRVEFLRKLYKKLSGKQFKSNVLIVGDGNAGKMLATKLLYENPFGLKVVGFIEDNHEIGEEIVQGKKVLGRLSDIHNLIKKHEVDEILISLDNITYEKLLDTLDKCNKLEVNIRLSSQLFKIVPQKVSTETYADIPVIDISTGYNSNLSVFLKRAFDFSMSALGIIILSPFFLIVSIIIKLTSPGSVLFVQTRIGKDGKPFKFYKFRSMYQIKGEDEKRKKMMIEFMKNGDGTGDTKIINDSRVTWIGKYLRKTSLDELPQLFNVLKGDMSLVGPRPCLPYEFENYDEWQKRRLNVLPGCTGVWQISGRSSVSFTDSIVLDLFYINSMSPWFDLQILLKTIPVMIFGRGGK